ncbi:hypothetical protein CP533_4563 [Ophiocordyceps camponoti-saundersi (nom. inval.)]|nr:hypothetical protein CP533_4563 [Ophiocordyceps camponoti-saundersi (nom. inval.)]
MKSAAALVGLVAASACAAHGTHDEGGAWSKEALAELEAKWGYEWAFSGIGSFAHLDHVKCLTDPSVDFDIAIIGAPFDTAVTFRPGARFGPRAIRQASARQTAFRGFNTRAGFNPYQNWAKIIDCGDIPITPFDNQIALEQMTQAFLELGKRKPPPKSRATNPKPRLVTLGGDHSLALPALRAIKEIYGRPVRVLHFDAHLDTWDPHAYPSSWGATQFTHGSMFWMANNEGLLSNSSSSPSVHAGLRTRLSGDSWADNDSDGAQGWVRFSADDMDEKGTAGIIEGIMKTLGTEDPVYLSVDIDVLDPAFAPGTGTPEPGGWTTRELIRVLRGIEDLNLVGADVVEVAPAYQGRGEETALAAAQVVYEMVTSMVKRGGSKERLQAKDELEDTIYVDTDTGVDDASADGSEAKPFKSLPFAYIQNVERPDVNYLTRASVTGALGPDEDASARLAWKAPAKSAVKKAQGAVDVHKKKLAKQQQVQASEDAKKQQRLGNLEASKKVVIKEDPSLPIAVKMTINDKTVALGDGESVKGARVKVSGRIHRLRAQKQATFITLVDGRGHLQCVLQAGDLTKTYDALLFAQGTSLTLYGEMRKVPDGQTAPDGRELHVDYYTVIGTSPGDEEAMTNKVSSAQNQWDQLMLDNRHLVLRGDNASAVMKLRASVEWAFMKAYHDMGFVKVSPPALVQTQVEGGATLFTVPYYDEVAYLTQSSQLYLETVLPSLGNVYCIEKSFRAEKSLTRRHLSEYTHVEAELDFIEFSDMLEHIEEVICRVVDSVLDDAEMARLLKELNPSFGRPSRPFLRMKYTDAIDWLNKQDPPILNEDGNSHVFGDDIAEAAERRMTDIINRPIFLTHFPVEIKAFYMKKDPSDVRVTESVDCLMPGVGEIVGGSMRMEGYEELLTAYEKQGISAKDYYWYTDQRKYGTSPHGGYGLGLERFLAWMANQHTVRTTCLYPRFMGRCKP